MLYLSDTDLAELLNQIHNWEVISLWMKCTLLSGACMCSLMQATSLRLQRESMYSLKTRSGGQTSCSVIISYKGPPIPQSHVCNYSQLGLGEQGWRDGERGSEERKKRDEVGPRGITWLKLILLFATVSLCHYCVCV